MNKCWCIRPSSLGLLCDKNYVKFSNEERTKATWKVCVQNMDNICIHKANTILAYSTVEAIVCIEQNNRKTTNNKQENQHTQNTQLWVFLSQHCQIKGIRINVLNNNKGEDQTNDATSHSKLSMSLAQTAQQMWTNMLEKTALTFF